MGSDSECSITYQINIGGSDLNWAEKISLLDIFQSLPDYIFEISEIQTGIIRGFSFLICRTGIGISITANRFKSIRASLCGDCLSAQATREHNDENVLALGTMVTGPVLAVRIVETFLNTSFSEDIRHKKRIQKIDE